MTVPNCPFTEEKGCPKSMHAYCTTPTNIYTYLSCVKASFFFFSTKLEYVLVKVGRDATWDQKHNICKGHSTCIFEK